MKYMSILLNWRIVAITLLAALALLLAMADSDDFLLLLLTKVAAVIIGYAVYRLAKRWERRMPELKVFNDDEEDIAF
jgi:ABC-type uncharacterized transport system permease subunit